MNSWFLAAAILSASICALHVVFGGREAAKPLLANDALDHVAKFTNYYCWHLVTIAIAALAFAYAYAALNAAGADVAVFATGIAFAFAIWSLAMIAGFRLKPLQFAQWALFLPTAALGVTGLLA